MAKVFGVGSQLSGKVGNLIYAQTKKGTVVYEAYSKGKGRPAAVRNRWRSAPSG